MEIHWGMNFLFISSFYCQVSFLFLELESDETLGDGSCVLPFGGVWLWWTKKGEWLLGVSPLDQSHSQRWGHRGWNLLLALVGKENPFSFNIQPNLTRAVHPNSQRQRVWQEHKQQMWRVCQSEVSIDHNQCWGSRGWNLLLTLVGGDSPFSTEFDRGCPP